MASDSRLQIINFMSIAERRYTASMIYCPRHYIITSSVTAMF